MLSSQLVTVPNASNTSASTPSRAVVGWDMTSVRDFGDGRDRRITWDFAKWQGIYISHRDKNNPIRDSRHL